jgi:hypothetical protein
MRQPKYTFGRRAVRWLGLTRNPLRRRIDRLERTLRIASLLAVFAVVVTSALTVLGGYHRDLERAEAERHRLQQVPVVLLGDASSGRPDAGTAGVPATWTLPDGTLRTGNVHSAPVGTGEGATVTVWMDAEYTPVRAPAEPADLRFRAFSNVLGCVSLFGVLIWGAYQAARTRLDLRRDADWTRGWLLYERRWRDRLH